VAPLLEKRNTVMRLQHVAWTDAVPAGRNLHTLRYACEVLRPAGRSNEVSYLLRPPVQF
jgi:hypothetical protein